MIKREKNTIEKIKEERIERTTREINMRLSLYIQLKREKLTYDKKEGVGLNREREY